MVERNYSRRPGPYSRTARSQRPEKPSSAPTTNPIRRVTDPVTGESFRALDGQVWSEKTTESTAEKLGRPDYGIVQTGDAPSSKGHTSGKGMYTLYNTDRSDGLRSE